MRFRLVSVILVLALAACGSHQPSQGSGQASDLQDVAAPTPPPKLPVMGQERTILAFGDSLFAGYGLDPGQSYPAMLQNALRVRGINARITNAGVSGDTTAAGLHRLKFTLDQLKTKPDLVLLELGGNDLLRGISPTQTRENLTKMLELLKKRHLPVLLMGMKAPPNLGVQYQTKFDAIYPALAKKFGIKLVPFFLQPVYSRPDLLQADHIHPTAAGVGKMVSATISTVVAALPPKRDEHAADGKQS